MAIHTHKEELSKSNTGTFSFTEYPVGLLSLTSASSTKWEIIVVIEDITCRAEPHLSLQ